MDLKKIVNICKKNKCFWVSAGETQLLSDGKANYLLSEDVPILSADVICALYDIDKDKMANLYLHNFFDAKDYQIEDTYENEEILKPFVISIAYEGKNLILFESSDGLILLDSDYLKPIDTHISELQFTLRDDEWIAIKKGFLLIATIHNYQVSNIDNFAEEIKKLYESIATRKETEFMKRLNYDEMEGELALEDE